MLCTDVSGNSKGLKWPSACKHLTIGCCKERRTKKKNVVLDPIKAAKFRSAKSLPQARTASLATSNSPDLQEQHKHKNISS